MQTADLVHRGIKETNGSFDSSCLEILLQEIFESQRSTFVDRSTRNRSRSNSNVGTIPSSGWWKWHQGGSMVGWIFLACGFQNHCLCIKLWGNFRLKRENSKWTGMVVYPIYPVISGEIFEHGRFSVHQISWLTIPRWGFTGWCLSSKITVQEYTHQYTLRMQHVVLQQGRPKEGRHKHDCIVLYFGLDEAHDFDTRFAVLEMCPDCCYSNGWQWNNGWGNCLPYHIEISEWGVVQWHHLSWDAFPTPLNTRLSESLNRRVSISMRNFLLSSPVHLRSILISGQRTLYSGQNSNLRKRGLMFSRKKSTPEMKTNKNNHLQHSAPHFFKLQVLAKIIIFFLVVTLELALNVLILRAC